MQLVLFIIKLLQSYTQHIKTASLKFMLLHGNVIKCCDSDDVSWKCISKTFFWPHITSAAKIPVLRNA